MSKCNQCGLDLTDPKNAGFPYKDNWYCSGYCAQLDARFWDDGETVETYNSQLKTGWHA